MCKSHFILIFLCLSLTFTTFPAAAQPQHREYKAGMSYTAVAAARYSAPEESRRSLHIKTAKPEAKSEAQPAQNTAQDNLPSGVSADIWNRYKALAAGNADENSQDIAQSPAADANAQPQAEQQAAPPAANTGLAGIINAYKENKKKRSQMRMLSIASPRTKESETN